MEQSRKLLNNQSKDVEFQDVFYRVKERKNFCKYRDPWILNNKQYGFRILVRFIKYIFEGA